MMTEEKLQACEEPAGYADGPTPSGDAIPFLRHQTADELGRPEESDGFRVAEEDVPAAIETILFAYGETVSLDKIAGILGLEKDRTADALRRLMAEVRNNRRRGIVIRQIEDSYILSTKPEMRAVIERMFLPRNRPPMSQAAYETLAIIAYNQPVTRSQVEAVRGVGSDSIIARLAERDLIRECGTLDAPGRPSLFETTELFLKEFGLSSVRDLPPMDMIMYRTLRDIESSVAEAAGVKSDNQMTIEQLVSSVVPRDSASLPADSGRDLNAPETSGDPATAGNVLAASDVMDISGAFFGQEDDGEEEMPDDGDDR